MKGDISADFHAPAKRYSGARAQAGRVLTDADFNAAFDILDDRLEVLVRKLLCAAGSPDEGLKIQSATPVTLSLPGGSAAATYEVTTAPGTFVLGGRVSSLDASVTSLAQSDWLSLPLKPSDLPPPPEAGRIDLVWLEQVERPGFAVEDRELQERALGSADTTTRLRPQSRIHVLADVPGDCAEAAAALTASLRLGGHGVSPDGFELLSAARLGIAFVSGEPSLDPCAPAAAAGYLGAENQTLRIMLTAPDRFVWAYDHGTPLYRVQIDAAAGEVLFLTEPRDPMLYPLPGQVIEILPWDVLLPNREKLAAPFGHLANLTGHYDPRNRRIAYDGSMPATWQVWLNGLPATMLGKDDDPPRFFYARIWQAPVTGTGPDQPTGANIVLPETGIALHFAGNGIAGDYWTASLRPAAPELIQPWNLQIDPAAGEVPIAPPIGPRRFHAPLALINWPLPLGPAPVIEDCRNRFRSLCRIKGCCTFQVGDGHHSFGDFNAIQDAIDALPAEGGEICLLPGQHEGRIDLHNRHDIRISGCGRRSRVIIGPDAAHPGRPGIWLNDASRIHFADFSVDGAGGPVFGATIARNVSLQRLDVLARDSSALVITAGQDIRISECEIRADALAAPPTKETLANLQPLLFIACERIVIERCHIIASFEEISRNLVAPGGIHIGGSSVDVRIEGNRIEGGNGHGIALGSLIPDDNGPGDDPVIYMPPLQVVGENGCLLLWPSGTETATGSDDATPPRSAGPVKGLRIRDNLIADHGGCGISVVHWFIPTGEMRLDELDDIELDEVMIEGNRIHRCMQLDLAAALPIESAFNSAMGGITLAAASDIVIDANEIRECGSAGRAPICGIYIRFAERLRITRNRISENGRPASLKDPLLVGNIGGIVIGHADGVEAEIATAVREVPAAVITGNDVVSPEGRALELVGTGAMIVQENSLTAHGNNGISVLLLLLMAFLSKKNNVGGSLVTSDEIEQQYRAMISQIGGSAVLILNTGLNRNLSLFDSALSPKMSASNTAGSDVFSTGYGVRDMTSSARDRDRPGGPVSFSDNMVTFDAQSQAITLSICSVAIVSLDDVGMHDNHCALDLGSDFVLINALVLGLVSCRVVGNRFRETLPTDFTNENGTNFSPTFLSAATFGLLNATEMNQGDYCFLTLGNKKPRIIGGSAGGQSMLDTNRHMIPDNLCGIFRKLSLAFGTN